MTNNRISTAFKISAAYFAFVMLVLLWYESSLGKTEYGGMIPGLILVLITMPGITLGGSVAVFFQCTRYSICEHVIGSLFGGGINAIALYMLLRFISKAWKKGKPN